jgi:dienelactone hydrolase
MFLCPKFYSLSFMIELTKDFPASASLHANPAGAKVRLLVLPDWQGGMTPYINRMASSYGNALNAETWILHPYHAHEHPRHYEAHGHQAVQNILSDRTLTRRWLANIEQALKSHWNQPDLPLVLLGFCFGGTLAFEAARTISAVSTAISIHGDPATNPHLSIDVHDPTMVFIQGGSDPLIPDRHINLFEAEMRASTRTWFQHTLGRARHSFTKQEVGYVGPGSVFDSELLAASVDILGALVPHTLPSHSISQRQGHSYA